MSPLLRQCTGIMATAMKRARHSWRGNISSRLKNYTNLQVDCSEQVDVDSVLALYRQYEVDFQMFGYSWQGLSPDFDYL